MFDLQGIVSMIFCLAIMCLIFGALIIKFNISSIKAMLLGVALICFSNFVLKGMVRYGIDDMISVAGLSLCIAGFFMKDK